MTLAEIAEALQLDERSVRRIEDAAIAKLRDGFPDLLEPELVVRAIVLVLGERPGISSIDDSSRRFSDNASQDANHAPRVQASLPVLSGGRRAGLLSRFPRKP